MYLPGEENTLLEIYDQNVYENMQEEENLAITPEPYKNHPQIENEFRVSILEWMYKITTHFKASDKNVWFMAVQTLDRFLYTTEVQ